MSIGSRIKEARKYRNFSQGKLAELCGWEAQSRISMYERNEREPSLDDIKTLSNVLEINHGWLATGEGQIIPHNQRDFANESALNHKSIGEEVPIIGYVPLISWVQAGDWHEPIDNFQPGDGYDMLPCPVPHSDTTYCVQVSGESMADEYPEGYIIFVDPKLEPRHNDDVIVRLLPENEVTFKRLMVEGRKKYLKAMNKNWPNPIIPINGDAEFCGVVIFAGKYPRK